MPTLFIPSRQTRLCLLLSCTCLNISRGSLNHTSTFSLAIDGYLQQFLSFSFQPTCFEVIHSPDMSGIYLYSLRNQRALADTPLEYPKSFYSPAMTCDQSPQANDPFLTAELDVWPELSSNELFNFPTGYYDFDPYFPEPWTEPCDFEHFYPLESVDPNLLCLDWLSLPASEAKDNLSHGILSEPTMVSANRSSPSSMSPGVSGASTSNTSNHSSPSSTSPGVSDASSSSTAKTSVSPDSRSGTNTSSSLGEVSNEGHDDLQESQSGESVILLFPLSMRRSES